MTNKSDEEIIEEIISTDEDTAQPKNGTESEEDALAKLSIKDDDSNNNNSDDELQPISNKKDEKESSEPSVIENEDKDDEGSKDSIEELDEEEFPIQKKQPKIFKILIAIAGLLSVVLVIGIILYFSGFFDPKPVEQPKVVQEVVKPKPEVVFDENDIDKKVLNKKLNMLTKKEIMTQEELEAEEKKIEEEKKRKEEEMKKALEEKKKEEELKLANQLTKIQEEKKALEEQQAIIKQQQEEFIKLQEQAKELEDKKEQILNPSTTSVEEPSMKETKTSEDSQNQTIDNSEDKAVKKEDNDSKMNIQEEEQTSTENNQISEPTVTSIIKENENKIVAKSFLSFINVSTIKGELYKSYLDEIEKYNKKISLCRNMKNNIEIYFGPFDSQVEREKIYNNLIENGYKDAYLVDFTAEEYDKRCKY